jgi:NAD(P)-dependent dehydrogenase (short-subunit alcohol dehydrogenase family)
MLNHRDGAELVSFQWCTYHGRGSECADFSSGRRALSRHSKAGSEPETAEYADENISALSSFVSSHNRVDREKQSIICSSDRRDIRMKLKGKVAFITGFGSGLGQAIAVMFAREGAAVAGTSTTESKGIETVAIIEKAGGKALFRAGDVGNSEQMKLLIAATVQHYGGLDIVVNSAGVRTNGSITDISEEAWDRTLETNLKGAFVVSRLAIPEMKRRGGGVILHIAARSGMLGQAGRAAYCASKGGLITLTEAMAMDHAKDKIRVNCICPGPVRTPMVDTSTPDKLARYETRVPLGRIGEPDDVAYAALYLASGEASYVTAAILPVDGGMRLTGP